MVILWSWRSRLVVELQKLHAVTVGGIDLNDKSCPFLRGEFGESGRDGGAQFANVSALGLSDEMLDGELPPKVEVRRAAAAPAEFATVFRPFVNQLGIAEQRLAIAMIVGNASISHRRFPRRRG
jgi:hypothetical protein